MPTEKDRPDGKAKKSDLFQEYLDGLPEWKNESADVRTYSEQVERETYAKMLSDIDEEGNGEIRRFMQDTLENYCQELSMLLSYIYENYWHNWIKEQRALQKEIQPIELYIALELILANQSDSSGYTKAYGSSRYPLTIPGNYSGEKKVRNNVDRDVPPAQFLKSYYKYGVHRFRVGHAIKNILDYLEERYGLDFEGLERIHQRATKSKS